MNKDFAGGVSPPERRRRPGAETTPFEKWLCTNSRRRGDNRALAEAQALAQQRLRRQHQVELIHRLGPRVAFELIDELDRYHGLGPDLDDRLAKYAALDPEVFRAVGGDRFPRAAIRIVEHVS